MKALGRLLSICCNRELESSEYKLWHNNSINFLMWVRFELNLISVVNTQSGLSRLDEHITQWTLEWTVNGKNTTVSLERWPSLPARGSTIAANSEAPSDCTNLKQSIETLWWCTYWKKAKMLWFSYNNIYGFIVRENTVVQTWGSTMTVKWSSFDCILY